MIKFSLDLKSGVPFHRQIVDQIRYGIASEALLPGEQLPTVRELAVELQVNPNTIRKAYSELEIRGIVTAQQGTGTFISDQKVEISDVERERILAEITRSFVSHAASYGFNLEEISYYLSELKRGE